jgi:hypothetical protein
MSIIRQKTVGATLALGLVLAAPASVKAQPVTVDVIAALNIAEAGASAYAATPNSNQAEVAQLQALSTQANTDAATYQANPTAANLSTVSADVTALMGYLNQVLGIHRG